MTVAGRQSQLRRLAQRIPDPGIREAVQSLEDKIIELERRLFDAEQRLTAGGL